MAVTGSGCCILGIRACGARGVESRARGVRDGGDRW